MNKKQLIFIVSLMSLIFLLAIYIIFYVYINKIEENRVYYDERLKSIEKELEDIRYNK